MSSRFILIVACVKFPSFLMLNNIPLYHILFIHSSVYGWLGFHFFAIANNVVMNTSIQMSVQVPAINSFRYIPRSGIPGSFYI